MSDVFLSYSRVDRAKAVALERALSNAGFDVFWDQETPAGVDWDSWIRDKLATAKVVVVLWSKNSIASPNVRHEAMIARDAGLLIPVLVEPLKPADFPMGLYLIQALSLAEWRGGLEDANLHRVVTEVAARLHQPAPPPQKHRKSRSSPRLWIAVAASTISLAILVVATMFFGIHVGTDALSIAQISVPRELADRGYGPDTVGSLILAEIQNVERGATPRPTSGQAELANARLDVVLPALNINLSQFLESLVSVREQPHRLSGRVVVTASDNSECDNDGCYSIFLFLDGREVTTVTAPKNNLDLLIRNAARSAVEKIDPQLLMSYYFHSNEPEREQQIDRLAQIVLQSTSPSDQSFANALVGVMHNRSRDWAGALVYFDRAIALDRNNASAFNSRCWAKTHIHGQEGSAIDDCRAALRIAPHNEDALDSLTFALEQAGQVDLAFNTNRCAQLIPHDHKHDVDIETRRLEVLALNPRSGIAPTPADCESDRLAVIAPNR